MLQLGEEALDQVTLAVLPFAEAPLISPIFLGPNLVGGGFWPVRGRDQRLRPCRPLCAFGIEIGLSQRIAARHALIQQKRSSAGDRCPCALERARRTG